MMEYQRAFLDYHGLTEADYLGCAVCLAPVADIHHIMGRRGKYKNDPRYLIGLCRRCHNRAHGIESPKITKEQQLNYLKSYGETTRL